MGRDEPDASAILVGKRKHIQTERAAAGAETAKKRKTTQNAGISTPHKGTAVNSPPEFTVPDTPSAPQAKATTSGQSPPRGEPNDPEDDLDQTEKRGPMVSDKTVEKTLFDYRKGFAHHGRPHQSCAADHHWWKGSKALAYTFLTYKDCQYDEQGCLTACQLHCAWCGEKGEGWSWSSKTDSLTGNYINHFKRLHPAKWKAAQEADHAVLAPTQTQSSQETTLEHMLSAWVSLAFGTHCHRLKGLTEIRLGYILRKTGTLDGYVMSAFHGSRE